MSVSGQKRTSRIVRHAPAWQPLDTDLFDPVSRRSDIVAARVAPATYGAAMLADMTFVASLLPGQFGEFNRLDFKFSMAQMATQARLPTWNPEAAPGALRPLLDVWKVRHAIRECARKRPQCCHVIGEALLIELDRIALLEHPAAVVTRVIAYWLS